MDSFKRDPKGLNINGILYSSLRSKIFYNFVTDRWVIRHHDLCPHLLWHRLAAQRRSTSIWISEHLMKLDFDSQIHNYLIDLASCITSPACRGGKFIFDLWLSLYINHKTSCQNITLVSNPLLYRWRCDISVAGSEFGQLHLSNFYNEWWRTVKEQLSSLF